MGSASADPTVSAPPLLEPLLEPSAPSLISDTIPLTIKLQLGLLISSSMLVQIGMGIIVPVLPHIAASIGLSATNLGLLIGLPPAVRLCVNLPIGHLVDTVGRKPPLMLGCGLVGLSYLATAYATSFAAVAAARLLYGVGNSAAMIAQQAYLMDVLSDYPKDRGMLLGTAQTMGMLAFAAGPAFGGILAEHGSLALPYKLIGGVSLIAAPLYAVGLRETLRRSTPPETCPHTPSNQDSEESRGERARSLLGSNAACDILRIALGKSCASYRLLLGQHPQQALLAIRVNVVAGWSAWLTVIPIAATGAWGATTGDLGGLFSCMTILGLAAAPVGGKLADRLGSARVAACCAAMTALVVGLISLASDWLTFCVCLALWDVGEAAMTAASSAYAAIVRAGPI